MSALVQYRTNAAAAEMYAKCRYCWQSRKLTGGNFLARRRSKSRLLIDMAPDSLPKSPVSSSPGDEVPHMFTRKPGLQLGKIVITSTKRLLQQYLPKPDSMHHSKTYYSITSSVSARSVAGISRPSVLAVLRLSTNSNSVDCMTGRSWANSRFYSLSANSPSTSRPSGKTR